MKEPEFCRHFTLSTARLSGRNLRDHYERIVNEQCEFHGWDRHGGVTGNLSGGEGDLDELGRNVRQILMDIEEKEAKKEAEKAAKEDLENKESAILDGEIQRAANAARGKRKAKAASGPDANISGHSSGSNSSHTSPDDQSPWAAIDELIFGRHPKVIQPPSQNHFNRAYSPDMEPLCAYFRLYSMREIAEVLKIRRLDFADDLEEIEARTLCIQFCMARWEYPTWEKNVTGFGLKPLEAFKLFNALCHVCDVHEKENKGSHTTPEG